MDGFRTALDLVQEALSALEGRGVRLHASPEVLSRLSAQPAAPVLLTAPAPAESAETPPMSFAPPPRPTVTQSPVSPRIPDVPRAVPILPFEPARPSLPAITLPAAGSKAERLAAMRGPVLACVKCPALVAARTQVVFGVGNPEAELMFVGEAPGADEDRQGEPFVGPAGQLLTKIIEAMGFARSEIYIANVLKCRPDLPPGAIGNRKPTSPEMQTCLPYLEEQISIIRPQILVALGATAMEGLLGEISPMNQLRGRWHDFRGTPLMATYHPSYLLRKQSIGEKRKVWEDMMLVLERLGRTVSEKQRGFFLQKG